MVTCSEPLGQDGSGASGRIMGCAAVEAREESGSWVCAPRGLQEEKSGWWGQDVGAPRELSRIGFLPVGDRSQPSQSEGRLGG